MAIERRVSSPFVEAAGFDSRNPGIFLESGNVGHDIRPRLGAVAGNLQVAVVGPNPDQLSVLRGF